MFGSSFGSGGSGFGQTDDATGPASAVIEPGPGGPVGGGATAAGGPTPPEVHEPQAIVAELDVALQHARMAQHRLIDVPLGTIPRDQVEALSQTFTTIEGNVADVAGQVANASGDQLVAATRDAREVTEQVQQFVEAVEGTLTEHGVQPSAAAIAPVASGPSIDPANMMLVGAAAVAVGVVGFSLWRLQQRKKAEAKEARAAARKPRKRRR